MTLTTQRRPRTVNPSEVTALGTAGGMDYVRIADKEYVAGRPFEAGTMTLRPGDLDLVEQVAKVVDGSRSTVPRHRALTEVRPGTYAKAAAKLDARRSRTLDAQRPRPVDVLASLSVLKATPPSIVSVSDEAGRPLGLPTRPGSALVTRGTESAASLDGALAFLADAGAVLRVVAASRLLVLAPSARQADCVAVAGAVARLIVGRLSGEPVRCEVSRHDAEASTIVALDVAACADCARGDA